MRYTYLIFLSFLLFSCSPTPYKQLQSHIKSSKESSSDFLFVLNGVLLNDSTQSKLYDLPKTDISVVEKVSEVAAKAIYGDDARPNTIIVNTKSLKE